MDGYTYISCASNFIIILWYIEKSCSYQFHSKVSANNLQNQNLIYYMCHEQWMSIHYITQVISDLYYLLHICSFCAMFLCLVLLEDICNFPISLDCYIGLIDIKLDLLKFGIHGIRSMHSICSIKCLIFLCWCPISRWKIFAAHINHMHHSLEHCCALHSFITYFSIRFARFYMQH